MSPREPGGNKTANLQSGMTIKAAAELMNVSERQVYSARELIATGRQDLIGACERGEISLHAALKQAKPEKRNKPVNGFNALCAAWRKASGPERSRFREWLEVSQ